jgi:hypothetical protein
MSDSSKLLTCTEFRAMRDQFQAERCKAVLPVLKEQLSALNAKIAPLEHKRSEADKHHKQAAEFELKPLWFDKQYIQAQLAMIEGNK